MRDRGAHEPAFHRPAQGPGVRNLWAQAGGVTRRLPATIDELRTTQNDGFEERTRIRSAIRASFPREPWLPVNVTLRVMMIKWTAMATVQQTSDQYPPDPNGLRPQGRECSSGPLVRVAAEYAAG